MTETSGSNFDSRDVANTDLSVDFSCEAGEPFADTTISDAYLNIFSSDAADLTLTGVNTSTGDSDLEAGHSTPTEEYYPQSVPQNGLAAIDAKYDTNDSLAAIDLDIEPIQGDADALYGQYTLVQCSTAATVDLYLQADNTGTPSCTVQAVITPTSH